MRGSNCMNPVLDQAERCVSCVVTPPELRPDLMFQCRLLQAVQSLLFCPIILILSSSCVTWPQTFEASSILKLVSGYFLECHGSCWDSCCCFCLPVGPTKGRTVDPKLPNEVVAPPRNHRVTSARSKNHLISLTGTVDYWPEAPEVSWNQLLWSKFTMKNKCDEYDEKDKNCWKFVVHHHWVQFIF